MTKEDLGILIMWLRQQNNMRQKDLADIMNVSASAVSKWEKGINYPDVECMQKLAECFHLTIDEFYEPEKTLQRLKNPDLEDEAHDVPTLPDFSARIKKIKLPSRKNLLIISAVLLFCLGMGCLYYFKYVKVYSEVVAERVGQDSNYGTSYDFAVYVRGKIKEEDLSSICEKLFINIISSKEIPRDTDVYRFLFYDSMEKAINWEDTPIKRTILWH